MKILYVKLVNYIGIFNGRGDTELEIDLSKTTTPIVIIKGYNGSGKSTLLRALSPMPDGSDQFIPNVEAKKVIVYQLGYDVIRIEYLYPIKKDGSRATTKAQVFKNDEPLNLTNNVSDAKEIIFTLFKLDTSFLALSQLTSTDRGLADKRPSERKIFVNSSIDGIEEYNNMYKTINKKFSMYKNLINSVVSKINKIGNKQELDISFNRINTMLENIVKERDKALSSVAKIQAKLDDNNSKELIEKYNSLESNIYSYNRNIESLMNELHNIGDYDISNIHKIEKDQSVELATKKANLSIAQNYLDRLNKEISSINSEIQRKIVEKNTYISTDISQDEIDSYNKALQELENINKDISNMNIDISNKEEIISLKDLFKFIINKLKYITDGLVYIDYEIGFDFILKNKNNDETWKIIYDLRNELSSARLTYNDNNLQINSLESLVDKADKLKLRPKNCKNDSCIFIKDAIEASKKNPSKELEKLVKENENLSESISELDKQVNMINDCIEVKNKFDAVYNKVSSYEFLLSKAKLNKLCNYEYLVSIARNNNYKFILDASSNLSVLFNLLELKSNYESIIDKYKDSIEDYKRNKSIIDSINSEIDSNKNKLADLQNEFKSKQSEKDNLELWINANQSKIILLGKFIETKLSKLEKYLSEVEQLKKDKDKLRNQVMQLEEISKDLESSKILANQVNDRYNEILKQRDILSYNKIMIEKYIEELAEYKTKYEKLETIRYYVSPTTGIQTVFMGAYMNNIIIKANELLSLIFNGQFVIQPFVINESEFRIPCLGSGIMNDDISSMSTSQVCMISMIISFAMLANADTDYNILKLDEIDGGLDPDNRSQFISLLNSLIQIVNCEQCFLISHNMEYSDKVNMIDMSAKPVKVL